MNIPKHLSHKPIVAVDYNDEDSKAGAGDALFLSIGQATWNDVNSNGKELYYSAKVFRKTDPSGRWSPQSEELPFWRVIDLATLLIAVINNKESEFPHETVDQGKYKELRQYIDNNNGLYQERINRLRKLING
jgi:hypothetical protein